MVRLAHSAPLVFGAVPLVSGALVQASNRQALVLSLPFSAAEISGHNPLIPFGLIFVLRDLLEKECETRTDFLVAFRKSSLSLLIYPTSAPPHLFPVGTKLYACCVHTCPSPRTRLLWLSFIYSFVQTCAFLVCGLCG